MYENIFTKYDSSIAGQKIKSLQTVEIGADAPQPTGTGQYRTVTVSLDANVAATLTGRYLIFSDGSKAYQIKYNTGYGYIFSENLAQWAKVSDDKMLHSAQSTLDELLELHKSILEKNLLCARGLELMTESGGAVPIEFKQRLFNLQANLINRNNALKNGGHVQNIQEGEHPELSKYNQALVNFMNAPGIGFVISTTAVIIILAIVSAASAAIAYGIFKALQKEAKADFSLSSDLTADLIKYLPAEVYDKLMKENAANAKIANDAISDASTGGIMQTVKTGALILAGVWIADKFIFNKRTNN